VPFIQLTIFWADTSAHWPMLLTALFAHVARLVPVFMPQSYKFFAVAFTHTLIFLAVPVAHDSIFSPNCTAHVAMLVITLSVHVVNAVSVCVAQVAIEVAV